jgi:hypothetical protein
MRSEPADLAAAVSAPARTDVAEPKRLPPSGVTLLISHGSLIRGKSPVVEVIRKLMSMSAVNAVGRRGWYPR